MKKKRIYQILIFVVLIAAVNSILVINKKIKIAPIFAGRFEVTGVDVSHYQGTVDWEKLAGQDIDFAFIKATEGSSHVDECFGDNWQEAGKTDLYVGAYHFFSFDSDGEKQAELYIDTVGDLDGKIAPAVDVEFYGDKESNPPLKDEVNKQLRRMLETLEEHYQVKPIIYTTYKVYHTYIKGEFDEYPLWIRNVYYQPLFTAGNRWTFWQYTDTAVLEGYQGTEKYIDLNVFRGTREELEKLTVRNVGMKTRDEVFTAVEEGDFDFEDKEPFYQYLDENGELQLELYYDERTAKGCGIRYYPEEKRTPQEFHFHANVFKNYLCDSEFLQERLNADPYELLANGRIDLSKDEWIEDYEEDIEYTSDGRPKHFKSQGWITYFGEEHELQKLLEIEFTYREDGTLKRRDYAHHTVALETWCSVVHSFYDAQERLAYEDCYITHGSQDYYYIYQGEEAMPSYCLVLDHDLGSLYAEVVAIHEMIEDEAGKRYGIVGPDLSNNNFVKAVRETGDYSADQISHTYEEDYDGDGYYEAFVIIGNCEDMWGEVTEDYITGDLWFVDHDKNAAYLQKATFDALQEYIRQDGKTYLFLNHDIGLPWMTDIYTVQDNEPVICAGESNRVKYLSKAGQVIQTQDAYDGSCDIQDEFGWSGHTWKPYTYEFDHGKLKEIGAKEVTLNDVVKIARLPESFDEKEYDGVQYILRDNGELNINMATYDAEYGYTGFSYFTYYADENGEWKLTDEGSGIYRIQLDGESYWDYLERMK